ncbi:glycoside hydrolase family 127 protein [Planctomycetes bacterium TBK1r]|uniref:Non-reducing end beta-L-arabinofuranosidase n=1 Tax=Stieleria magnilauensis TaxID=2527963 RepID=A0ABX5XWT2_9BACT|nr:Non-reducing end beta-L-arabinofuranosidase [Planctomycetes bacterium TBK1r]
MKNVLLILCSLPLLCLSQTDSAHAQQRGVINNAESPHVKLKSIDIGDCQWTSGFWADKFKLCEEVMVPHMGMLLKGDRGHAYNNFKIAAGLKQGTHQGMHWHDGDFYKWMEAAMYVYAINKDPQILEELDEIIAVIGQAQADDGYLSTQITIPGLERFSNRQFHELYNSGHLLTSACIHHRVTGKTNFLDIAVKHADYLYDLFEPQPKELARFGFNQTQIMGLVELYRTTKDKRYLQLAEIFINMRGKSPPVPDDTVRYKMVGDMVQERKPLRKETEAVGHAVLALYFYAGAADVVAETGERALIDALDRLWDNVVHKKMYITGACGQTHHGASSRVDFVHEAFIGEYMMPNLTAYNETCANLCNAMFSLRMLGIHGESKYADIMELVMFNSGLSGISADGTHYIYSNPLRVIHGARDYSALVTETPDRQPYLECFCCPPNLVRTVAQLSGWAYSLSPDGVAVNLYGGNRLDTTLLDGSTLKLTQDTHYPWEGAVKITIQSCKPTPFEIMLRIPDWAEATELRVNGKDVGVTARPGTYAKIKRSWKSGDVIAIDMPMEAKLMVGHPRIEEIRNQAAIKRGPVVYCIESPDLPENTKILDVFLPTDIELKTNDEPTFLGGMTTLTGNVLLNANPQVALYQNLEKPAWKSVETKFVPYYAWSNRGRSEMSVWLPLVWK